MDINGLNHKKLISFMVSNSAQCLKLLEDISGIYVYLICLLPIMFQGSSSIGSSINAQFLAAFSAAAGKKSVQFFESEESDPEVKSTFNMLCYAISILGNLKLHSVVDSAVH